MSLVIIIKTSLREKCPNTEFFLVRILPHLEYLSVFSPNAGKYGPEKTPYLDTFHAVFIIQLRVHIFKLDDIKSTENKPTLLF